MKKLIALLLVLVMTLTLFTACANTDNNDDTDSDKESVNNGENKDDENKGDESQPEGGDTDVPADLITLEILTTIWDIFPEDYKFFAMGGDSNAYVEGAPGAFDITNTDGLSVNLVLPADLHGQIDDAASLFHAMNANTFTGAVYHLTAGTDAAALAETLRQNIQSNHWMCGWPEKLYIAVIDGEYVVQAFGAEDLVQVFVNQLVVAYTVEEIVYEGILG